jgi:uncharacterized damage-inducible protein DinB
MMELLELYEQIERLARPGMLANLEKLSAEEFTREMPVIGLGSIRNALVHIPSSEYFWVRRVLQGDKGASLRPYEDYATVGEVRSKWLEVAAETKRFLRELTPAQLLEAKTYRFPDGEATLRTDYVIHHILTHEFHHKGQLMMALRILGYEPQETDLI